MGCFDGAEVCELVGLYILDKLSNVTDKNNIGLYRDDGLGILKNLSGPEMERTRKVITKLFQDCGVSITIKVNQKVVHYLDI